MRRTAKRRASDPRHVAALLTAAHAALRRGDVEEAARIAASAPRNDERLKLWADMVRALARGDLERAQRHAQTLRFTRRARGLPPAKHLLRDGRDDPDRLVE